MYCLVLQVTIVGDLRRETRKTGGVVEEKNSK